jgi:hypothetical protein
MTTVNSYQFDAWIGGGISLTWSVAPVDFGYWDVTVSPDYLTDPLESPGNLEISRKGVSTVAHAPDPIDEPEGKTTYTLELWFDVQNDLPSGSYLYVNVINVHP